MIVCTNMLECSRHISVVTLNIEQMIDLMMRHDVPHKHLCAGFHLLLVDDSVTLGSSYSGDLDLCP
jgi:hypothetical protein